MLLVPRSQIAHATKMAEGKPTVLVTGKKCLYVANPIECSFDQKSVDRTFESVTVIIETPVLVKEIAEVEIFIQKFLSL